MKRSLKIILIIIVALIAVLLIGNYYLERLLRTTLRTDSKNINLFVEPPDLSKIENSLSPEQSVTSTIEYKHFTSPDNKLTLRYPNDWIEIKNKEKLKGVAPQELTEKYNLKVLLLAQKPKMGTLIQLVVNEGFFQKNTNFQDVIEIMKESNQKDGWEMEVTDLEIKEMEAIFEARYSKQSLLPLFSEEKLILFPQENGKEKMYLVAVISFEKDREKFIKEMKEIINSTHFVK